jgi:LacI family transcriptional regulator
LAERGLAAIFCANDRLAMGAMRAAAERGRVVGRDLSIVGHDDLSFSGFTDPPLTTIHQPIRATGRRLAELVLARLATPQAEPVSELWQPNLVLRGSHAAAPGMAPARLINAH